jgi:predicted CXXCH cytochrome family protein
MGSDPLNPPPEKGGGNFIFLLEDDINDGVGYPIDGNRAGHNVASIEWGIPVDPNHIVGPGGTYPSDKLTCTSCHDPHGNQNYRMLRGLGSTDNTGFVFIYDAPQGEGIGLDGRESPANHTAYRGGWSDWCANCHGFYHDEIYQGFEHPMDRPMNMEMRDTYNQYNGPLDPYGGDISMAYVPEVPFESRDMTTTSTTGPFGWSRLACISCHRAHATSAPSSTRWDPNVEFLDDDGLQSGSYPLPNPYSEQGQRALCVKCHYPVAEAHGWGRPCLECHRE